MISPAGQGAGDGFGMPRVPIGFIAAPEVRRQLGSVPSLVVFRSPRGWGKTSTASHWLRRHGSGYDRIWINVPSRDVDREEFWRIVYRRISDAGLGDLTGSDTWDDVHGAIWKRGRDLIIAIDGLHHVTDLGVDEELLALVNANESFHLFVTARSERPIETLAKITADGMVFRVAQLTLGTAEVAELAEAVGLPVSLAEAQRLRTELGGWPALVRAVLGDSSRGPDGELRIDWSAVEKYTRLVLSDPDVAATAAFVMAIAVPREFTEDIAAHVLGRGVADLAFDYLTGSGLLTRSAAPGPPAFHYSSVVRHAILRVYAERDPEGYQRANRDMAAWYRERGVADAALEHAVRAEDWPSTASLIEAFWVELVSGHPDQVRDALGRLPAALVRGSARLLVARDYILNVDTSERSLSALRAGLLDVDSDLGRTGELRLSLGQVLSLRSTGQYEVAREIVERQRVDLLTAEGDWTEDVLSEMPELLLQWSITRLFGADTVGAAYAFREAYRWAGERGLTPAKREAGAGLALSLAVLGHTLGAQRWLARVEGLARSDDTEPTTLEHLSVRFVQEIIDLDSLRLEVGPQWCDPKVPVALGDLRAIALQLHASRSMHAGSRFDSIGMLESYRQQLQEQGRGPGLADNVVVTALVDLLIQTGQSDRARAMLAHADPASSWQRLALARHSLYAGEFEDAIAFTDNAVPQAGVRPRTALHLALIRASASHRAGLADQAADALHLAIAVAEQSGQLRPFLMVPRADLEEIGASMPQAAEFLYRPELVDAPELFPAPHEAIRLSERELRVLTEIAPGLSLSHAARRLYVSENTIKTQMRNIYRKLGVHTREDAIDRARELGLLAPLADVDSVD
ncbi:LuxR C-terminal-related transcriptional regulator [Occultella glacieicola]|nr:LuxR C-terminal-related transcriptional regulator [Occultella glacieicola]